MKKLFILMAMVAFVFTSCKKDYTCTCTNDSDGTEVSSTPINNASKSDAEDACTAINIVSGITCELD